MANLFEAPRYIAVEGPIRVGKSTLARILAERLNAQRVMEPEENPFLTSFYEGERGSGVSGAVHIPGPAIRTAACARSGSAVPENRGGGFHL